MFAARFFIVCLVLGLGVALLAGQDVGAQDTLLISYQGRLTDNAGNPLDGTYDLSFDIYAVSAGGASLWSELHPGVIVSAGLFSVTLGSQTALPDSVFTGDTRYLGITINDNPEITPRTMLTSVASAAYARRVAGDVTTGAGTMLIKTPAGDSAFSFDAGTAKASSPTFKMFNPQPEPPARLLEMNVSQDPQTLQYGSRLSMYLTESLSDKVVELSGYPTFGASFKMFNPQPEPPAVLFEINANPATGASLNIYDEIGQVMGVEPSPFNSGYRMKFIDPGDDGRLLEIGVNHATDEAGIYLIDPGDDGYLMSLISSPLAGSSFKMFNPQPEPPAVLCEINANPTTGASLNIYDEIGQVMGFEPTPFNDGYRMKLIDPGDDGRLLEITGNHASDQAGIYLIDPGDDGYLMSLTSSPLLGGSIKLYNPLPDFPATLFDLSTNTGKSSDDIEMSLTSGDSTFQTKITPGRVKVGHPTIDSYARGEFNAGSDSITFFMQGQSIGAPAPPIGMLSSSSGAKLAIGSMTAGEPLVVGKDLGSWNGDRIVVGDDTPGQYTGLVAGESSDHRGWLLWNIDDDFFSMGLQVGLFQYNNLLTLRNGRVGINTSSPSADLHVAGDICYTGSIGACSDLRYKRDVRTLDHSLEKVARLRGVSFAWRTDAFPEQKFSDDEQVGLIAQEVNEVVPEVVSRTADGYYNVDYTKLTPLLVEAIKELKAENEELRSRIEQLERQ